MTLPTITTPPPAPSRNDPANFPTRADAHVAYIATLVADLNALVAAINAYGDGFPLFVPTGSAAAPGLSFVGDGDTGLFRAGANILGLATGGVEQARITAAGLQLTGLLSGTAVVQSASDTTAGRLLTPGWMGLGATSSPALDNIDRFDIPQGFYRVSNAWTLGTLPSGATTADAVIVMRPDAMNTIQICMQAGSGGRVYTRRSSLSTAWWPWRKIIEGDVIGTVSQSSGVPTGALFETGSNANGDYERLASGSQVCTMVATTSTSGTVSVTFPVAFTSTAYRCSISVQSTMSCFATISSKTASGLDLSCWDLSGARVAKSVDLTVRGRWF